MLFNKPIILTFCGYYLPGYKGGGPIRTIESMVELLGDEFIYKIITRDRDLGSTERYDAIQVNEWQKVGKAEVFYVSPDKLNLFFLRKIISETPHDILYLNSFFSPKFTILPMMLRRLGLIPKRNTIIAPRGEFSPGAINIKRFKKKIFILITHIIGLYSDVTWHVSSFHEQNDLFYFFKDSQHEKTKTKSIIASDLTDIVPKGMTKSSLKEAGRLKVVFISRISPKKNLDGALKLIADLKGKVLFDIYGPLEDKVYWDQCCKLIEKLPSNIKVSYKGFLNHDEVLDVFAEHDLFFFPTLGENFGHVIIEALAAGCPVLISDRTPWRNLEKENVGWDIPIEKPEYFNKILQKCLNMGNEEMEHLSNCSFNYAKNKMIDKQNLHRNRSLFLKNYCGK